MAITILAHNGIGFGHLSRCMKVASHLYAAGHRPFLFYQHPEYAIAAAYVSRPVEKIYETSDATCERIAQMINSACVTSTPSIFIEDTHPLHLPLPEELEKILLVRPTEFSFLLELRKKHSQYYRHFLVCDHPESPTWPYSEEETIEILSWPQWRVSGPIYQTPSPEALERVRKKYGIGKAPVYVFSMGGGGMQEGANDGAIFVEKAIAIGRALQNENKEARLIFVKGPLFKGELSLPSSFEIIGEEKEMAALFELSEGAMIRPGFNSTWECIHGVTPFVAVTGTTYREPVAQKLEALRRHGLYPDEEVLLNPARGAAFREQCRQIRERFDGNPMPLFDRLVADKPVQVNPVTMPVRISTDSENSGGFFIRVDDIATLDAPACALLEVCAESGLPFSLEVIPYLARFREDDLERYRSSTGALILSQHGYSHLINLTNGPGLKSEFCLSGLDDADRAAIASGKEIMERQFRRYFRGGFSAPFDNAPAGLYDYWHSIGGLYLSSMQEAENEGCIGGLTDAWNWPQRRLKPMNSLLETILGKSRRGAVCGLVLHPRQLATAEGLDYLRTLFQQLSKAEIIHFNFNNLNRLSHVPATA